ncbi:hypothetical protein DFH07DRAFT_833643 [Mycena maculata]|uniref:Uncharacterized protein n=1 Tax=Mycena maculata TaxID=230809 RepID=A0AAD7IKR9_9AGAR|nr:hypothetical protein DFH07DRAFT_833643 [Mycena maculata]
MHNYTFALLLEGYFNTVELYYSRSTHRGEMGDDKISPGSHLPVTTPIPPPMGTRTDRISTQGWYTALQSAYEARAYLQRAHQVRSNERAERGLECLYNSLKAWPSVGRDVELMLPVISEERKKSIIQNHQRSLLVDPNSDWHPHFPGVFPLTAQARRNEAVESFWARLHGAYRKDFEGPTIGPEGSFRTLGVLSEDPTVARDFLRKLGSPMMVDHFLKILEECRVEGLWRIVV